jgi:hypothetical protein
MNTATDLNHRWMPRGRPGWRAALIAALAALVMFGLPAAASEVDPTPAAFTIEGTVTWVGRPDSMATTIRVAACPGDEPAPFCPNRRATTAADDGSYSLPLPYGRPTTWDVFAVVSVGSPSPGPSLALTTPVEATVPRSPHAPVSLAITTRAVGMRVVDGAGNAFPEGMTSVMAVPTSSSGPGMSVGGADANGDALLLVDPAVEYNVNAFALNTGWPDPWVSPDGTEFHFSRNSVTALGADLLEGTTFVIVPPA